MQVFRVQPCKPECSWGPGFLLASLGTSLCTWTSRTCQEVMFRPQCSVHPSPTTWDGQLSSVPTPQFYDLSNRICSATTFQFLPDLSLVMSNTWIMTSETWLSVSAILSHTSYFPWLFYISVQVFSFQPHIIFNMTIACLISKHFLLSPFSLPMVQEYQFWATNEFSITSVACFLGLGWLASFWPFPF